MQMPNGVVNLFIDVWVSSASGEIPLVIAK